MAAYSSASTQNGINPRAASICVVGAASGGAGDPDRSLGGGSAKNFSRQWASSSSPAGSAKRKGRCVVKMARARFFQASLLW